MGITTIADLDAIIQTIVSEVQYTARHEPVMANLVWRMSLPEHKGHPIDVPKLGTLTASSLTEGIEMANPQTLSDTKVTITPAENGLLVVLTDRMLARAPSGFFAMVGSEAGRAYAKKLDTDLLGLFSGFTTYVLGDGTAVVNLGQLSAGRAIIKGNPTEPGPDPIFAVHHPWCLNDLVDSIAPYGTYPIPDGISEEVMRNHFQGRIRLYGIDLFEDGNIAIASDIAWGAVFSKKSAILIVTQEPKDERTRNAKLRATELTLVGEYGYGEYQDVWAAALKSKAVQPV